MPPIVVGIDASRIRSGGGIDHMIGTLSAGNPLEHGVREIHVWSYRSLLEKLPDAPWLVKHNPPVLERSLVRQVWWQYYQLPREMRKKKCDILFAADAGTVCLHSPMVVFSQDAQSYESGIQQLYGLSLERLRLILLFHIQNRAMRHAAGTIFLTRYASNLIQSATGKLRTITVTPHGVDRMFSEQKSERAWPANNDTPIRCIYVSNVAMYKNQWVVVRAVRKLRDRGRNVELLLVGDGSGKAKKLLDDEMSRSDPNGSFVKSVGFVVHEDLPKTLASSDIFVFASRCETISVTLLEAMAVGLPIACSNQGPMPEVLEDGGVYFDPESSESIASAIEQIIGDEVLRTSIARRARELSTKYTWARCASQTWDFLRDVFEKEAGEHESTASGMAAAR